MPFSLLKVICYLIGQATELQAIPGDASIPYSSQDGPWLHVYFQVAINSVHFHSDMKVKGVACLWAKLLPVVFVWKEKVCKWSRWYIKRVPRSGRILSAAGERQGDEFNKLHFPRGCRQIRVDGEGES